MTGVLIVVAYSVVGVGVARFVYGRLRRQAIKDFGVNWTTNEEADEDNIVLIVGFATVASIPLWPAAVVLCAVFCNPPKTTEEIKAERDKAIKELEEIERNVGLR